MRSEIGLLHGRFTLSFIRNFQIFPQRGRSIVHSHQQSMVASHLLQNLVLSVFLIFAMLVGKNISQGFPMQFPMTADAELFVLYLSAVCVSSLGSICSVFLLFLLVIKLWRLLIYSGH